MLPDFEAMNESYTYAYHVFRKITNLPYNYNSKIRFMEFLYLGTDQTYPVHRYELDFYSKLPEQALTRIRWLNGPNAAFMYKIWRAKYPEF